MSAPRVVCVGNALIDHTYTLTNLPAPDDGAYVLDYEERFGGVETNVAAVLRSLGTDAGVIARLGDDADGRAVAEHLEALGLATERLRRGTPDTTSYCLVLTADGERVIIGGGDSTLALELDAADREYLAGAELAFASAYAPAEVIGTLAELDVGVAFDLAGRFADLDHRGFTRAHLDDALPGIELFVTNVSSARSYLRADDPPRGLVAGLRDRGATRGAVTAGEAGALVFDATDTYEIEAYDVDVLDTTGAGDAFTAGLIHAWMLEDRAPEPAGRFAAAAAARNCTVRGAHANPPTVDGVEALLD